MVFFNDQFSNDFNTLFISLPPNRQYFAAGVPGSFYGRLFPKASLHFIHSSYALQWLSNGLSSEAKVDAFNLPSYFTSSKELKALIERSQHFNIERMEILNNQENYVSLRNPSMCSLFLRAALEGVIAKHFGNDIMDELFNRYTEKVAESSFLNPKADKSIVLFVLLKNNN
ncbi:putative s-adenosylmethionine-dependent methyltransferase [Quercus suber]|uniref:S-adenosylmethionine-dependent methyltransferase n=1 Tax=Quercus suber TaxID=58331 RepID=A0AAW0LCD6_QUESU